MSKKQIKRGNPLWYLFKQTWKYSEGSRRIVTLYWGMFILAGCVELLVGPFLWAKLMERIQREGVTEVNLNSLLCSLFFVLLGTIVFWFLHGPARVMECNNAFKTKLNYRKFLLRGVMTMPMDWHVNNHSGDIIDKIDKGTSAIYQFTEDTFEIVYWVVRFLGSFVVLAYFFPPSAVIVAVMALISASVIMRFDKILIGRYVTLNKAENEVAQSVFDSISNITTVIILRVEKLVFEAILHKAEKPFELFKKTNLLGETKWFISNLCCTFMVVTVMGLYFYIQAGVVESIIIGNIFLLYKYLSNISDLFNRFAYMYGDVIKRTSRLMNAEILSENFTDESFANHVLPSDWKKLEVSNLNFSYHGKDEGDLHLDNVSFSINRGERIAFVGGSGEGKTTCLNIIRDLYHPQSIRLTVDDREVSDGFAGIARAIALVPQSPDIFADTIEKNITLGAEYPIETVRKYADMACFTDVADGLPKGFDSAINERGVNLSGGQKQRLALARALLACEGKDILLLDEPTSSLDAVTDRQVYDNILAGFPDKTIVATVHGLHLLPLFDRIFVFEKGKIVGNGSLSDLIDSCPQFQVLWKAKKKVVDVPIPAYS